MRNFCSILLLFLSIGMPTNAQERVGIFTYRVSGQEPWDPESIHKGIAGSEESIIYVAEELAHLGYKVIVFGNPPLGSLHTNKEANPRYVNSYYDDTDYLDIAIAWRSPYLAPSLRHRAKKLFLWPHDTFHEILDPSLISLFNGVLWLSAWQREQWISINPSFLKFNTILGGGVPKSLLSPMEERKNPYSCIYASNYARGLEILLDIWPIVSMNFPGATLDIYYGWQHWGLLDPAKERQMREQIAHLAPFGVTEHGKVSHAELSQAFQKASLWTYPCIGLETFCITGIRAQMTGTIPVIIRTSALAETVPDGYQCLREENYLRTLLLALEKSPSWNLEKRLELRSFVLEHYTWDVIAKKWKIYFDQTS